MSAPGSEKVWQVVRVPADETLPLATGHVVAGEEGLARACGAERVRIVYRHAFDMRASLVVGAGAGGRVNARASALAGARLHGDAVLVGEYEDAGGLGWCSLEHGGTLCRDVAWWLVSAAAERHRAFTATT